jgi:DNA-binding transcriptional LysR family regulator
MQMQQRLSGISFQHLEVFVTAAKYQNFSKTSQALNMTQASVSRNIAAFELLIGVQLFERQNHRVVLTDLGKVLAKDAEGLLKKAEMVFNQAYTQQQFRLNQLRIGDHNEISESIYLVPILNAFEAENPDIEINVERISSTEIIDKLLVGEYDAAFCSRFAVDMLAERGLVFTDVAAAPPCAVISIRNPLFGEPEVSLRQLSEYPVLVSNDPKGQAAMRSFCAEVGLDFPNTKPIPNLHTMVMEFRRGNYVVITDRFLDLADPAECRYIELPGSSLQGGIVLAYVPNQVKPGLQRLITVCQREGKKLKL